MLIRYQNQKNLYAQEKSLQKKAICKTQCIQ